MNVGVVQDGATELWQSMRAALFDEFASKGRRWGVLLWKRLPWRETIDWYHVMVISPPRFKLWKRTSRRSKRSRTRGKRC